MRLFRLVVHVAAAAAMVWAARDITKTWVRIDSLGPPEADN